MADVDLQSIRSRMSLLQWIWWYMLELPCCLWVRVAYRFRSWGETRIPRRGSVLLVSNHQSYLDPIFLGVAGHHRPFYAMARSTLFGNRFFAWLLGTLRCIPIDKGTGDLAAMRRCMEVLRCESLLLVFPEGSRSLDGRMGSFSPGTMALIKRTRPTVVPVAIDGSSDAWPRGGRLRLCGRVGVLYGDAIAAERLLSLPPAEALCFLESRVQELRGDLAQRLRGTGCR